jgi:hypothetical protein
MHRTFAELDFELVGRIDPERDASGQPISLMPQSRYAKASTTPLNPHGSGPFCRFAIAAGDRRSGVYVLTVNGAPVYAGKCTNLARRWGPMGYGGISPKNCFVGGQSTNCKVNHRVYAHSLRGDELELWFHHGDPDALEPRLIVSLGPAWNAHVPT